MTSTPRSHVLREYALVADGQRGALIGPDGTIDWLCAPRWDSPAVFSGLLGGQGRYAVTPSDPRNVWGGYYEAGSLIWRSRWTGHSARTECREALALPADPHRVVILRRIEAADGPARVDVLLDVRGGFGRSKMRADAALLLPVIRGAVPPGDPCSSATIRAVREELAEDGYVYRFRHDPRPLHQAEGAFLLCGFWLAQVAQACGEHAEAAHWFERNRAACGPAGLYTEEYDVHQRQLRGNLPQAFVHAGLLETAARMSARS